MSDNIWYVAYGSNLLYERFSLYVDDLAAGHRPVDDFACEIPGRQVYFATSDPDWCYGGIAFLARGRPIDRCVTKARAYLLTATEFAQLVARENGLVAVPGERFAVDELLERRAILTGGSFYDVVECVGEKNTVPMAVLTTRRRHRKLVAPCKRYLHIIARGLRETHRLRKMDLVTYLLSCPGVQPHYSVATLTDVVNIRDPAAVPCSLQGADRRDGS